MNDEAIGVMLKAMNDAHIASDIRTVNEHAMAMAECVPVLQYACNDEPFIQGILKSTITILDAAKHDLYLKQEHMEWKHGEWELSDGEHDYIGYLNNAITECERVLAIELKEE